MAVFGSRETEDGTARKAQERQDEQVRSVLDAHEAFVCKKVLAARATNTLVNVSELVPAEVLKYDCWVLGFDQWLSTKFGGRFRVEYMSPHGFVLL